MPLHPMKLFFAIFALVLICLGYHWTHRPITYPPGVLITEEPEQTNLPANTTSIEYGPFHLKPLARFTIEARLLHRKIYRYDREAALAPVDLAVGWGPMSDQAVLDRLDISQSMRFFWYEYRLPPPIPPEQIVSHGANLHIIPATAAIETECKSLRQGALIHLQGELVEATGPGIGTWRSSLTRTDTGNGACELVWVEEVRPLGDDRGAVPLPRGVDKRRSETALATAR
jgi:hypothetical protein